PNMRADGTAPGAPLVGPNLRHQLLARDDRVGLRGEQVQQVELLARHVDDALPDAYLAFTRVDVQGAVRDRDGFRRRCRYRPAQHGFHPRDQLTELEGLDDGVVGSGMPAQYPV